MAFNMLRCEIEKYCRIEINETVPVLRNAFASYFQHHVRAPGPERIAEELLHMPAPRHCHLETVFLVRIRNLKLNRGTRRNAQPARFHHPRQNPDNGGFSVRPRYPDDRELS
jgi:hypothetical protein